jgi:hypothetical protein
MEQRPRHSDEEHEQPLPGEAAGPPTEVEPGEARRIIEGGIATAEAGGQRVDDWVAGHIAQQLKTEDRSALDLLSRSGEINAELQPELLRAYTQQLPRRRWVDALHSYAMEQGARGPVDGWAEQARRRDQFHTAWHDRNHERGNRFTEGGDLDRAVRWAQETRQVIGEDLTMRLLVRLATNPHSAVARFAGDGKVTDQLSQELQEKYLSGTEQERRWLNELGSWIAAKGKPSPVPWWRSPASAEAAPASVGTAEPSERSAARLADLEERLAPLPDLGDIPRPPQGHGLGDGYDWMAEALPPGWQAEPVWGRDGWDLGTWPLVVVALYIDDDQGNYAVATYVEGDVDVHRYKSRGALYVAVNKTAEFYWRHGSPGPRDLPEGEGLLARHTGPYTPWRSARDAEMEG